jgi:nucleotide-binding universal stress UspA family protein
MTVKEIIAATDGSEESLRAVEWAAREAIRRGEPLRIVSAPPASPWMNPDPAERETVTNLIHQAAERALSLAKQRATETEPGLAVVTELLPGPPAQTLPEISAGASMLVLGSRGTGGFSALVLGSVSRYVATHALCPVVVAREETMAVHRQVIVGVHDPDKAAAALEFAFQEASLRQASLLALHVAWAPQLISLAKLTAEQRAAIEASQAQADTVTRLDGVLALWRHKYPGVEAAWEVVHANPGRVLAGASARADLVVLGRQIAGPAVGTVTHAVLSHAHGPVAIVASE